MPMRKQKSRCCSVWVVDFAYGVLVRPDSEQKIPSLSTNNNRYHFEHCYAFYQDSSGVWVPRHVFNLHRMFMPKRKRVYDRAKNRKPAAARKQALTAGLLRKAIPGIIMRQRYWKTEAGPVHNKASLSYYRIIRLNLLTGVPEAKSAATTNRLLQCLEMVLTEKGKNT